MKQKLSFSLLLLAVLAFLVSRSFSKPASDEETLRTLETEWTKHINNTEADVAFQKSIVATHSTIVDVFGNIHDQTPVDLEKMAAESKAANPDAKASVEIKDMKVHIYGDTATVTYAGNFTSSGMKDSNMNVTAAPFSSIDVWQKQSGKWKFIAGANVSTQPIPAEAYKASGRN
jgi:ketosteroid isomerase-like protein